MKLSADEVTVPIDWPLFDERGHLRSPVSSVAYCCGCGEQLAPPVLPYPNETKPHTVLDCLKTFAKRSEIMEARRDG